MTTFFSLPLMIRWHNTKVDHGWRKKKKETKVPTWFSSASFRIISKNVISFSFNDADDSKDSLFWSSSTLLYNHACCAQENQNFCSFFFFWKKKNTLHHTCNSFSFFFTFILHFETNWIKQKNGRELINLYSRQWKLDGFSVYFLVLCFIDSVAPVLYTLGRGVMR